MCAIHCSCRYFIEQEQQAILEAYPPETKKFKIMDSRNDAWRVRVEIGDYSISVGNHTHIRLVWRVWL
jgi:hypothetical protein